MSKNKWIDFKFITIRWNIRFWWINKWEKNNILFWSSDYRAVKADQNVWKLVLISIGIGFKTSLADRTGLYNQWNSCITKTYWNGCKHSNPHGKVINVTIDHWQLKISKHFLWWKRCFIKHEHIFKNTNWSSLLDFSSRLKIRIEWRWNVAIAFADHLCVNIPILHKFSSQNFHKKAHFVSRVNVLIFEQLWHSINHHNHKRWWKKNLF